MRSSVEVAGSVEHQIDLGVISVAAAGSECVESFLGPATADDWAQLEYVAKTASAPDCCPVEIARSVEDKTAHRSSRSFLVARKAVKNRFLLSGSAKA